MWADPRRADVAGFLGYGPFLPAGDGGLLAVAPGALVLGSSGARAAGRDRQVEVVVRDVRTRRGYAELVAELDGHPAHVRVPAGQLDAQALVGRRVRAHLDAAACPRVTA